MLTRMTEADWEIVVWCSGGVCPGAAIGAGRSPLPRGAALFHRAERLMARASSRVWELEHRLKRFSRLSGSGVFEAFFQALAELSPTAHLVQVFDSTTVRAHVSVAEAKGGSRTRRSPAPAVVSLPRRTSTACRLPFT